jgi:hypothetical protein
MKIKASITHFLLVFAIAFLANVLVSLIWSYFIKKAGLTLDWEASVRISIILAIVLSLIKRKK